MMSAKLLPGDEHRRAERPPLSRWRAELDQDAQQALQRLSAVDRLTLGRAIQALPDGDTGRLKRELKGYSRLKVDRWRVIFSVDRKRRQVTLRRIALRESAYDPLPTREPKT
jgi:mRNA-degrading endonuclease RelE of RelBE toxin-antitoxin system